MLKASELHCLVLMSKKLWLLFAFAFCRPSWSMENSLPCWADLFFSNRNPPTLTSAPLDEQVKNLAAQIKTSIAEKNRRVDLRSLVLGQPLVDMTTYLTRRNGHLYPFYFVRRGIPQKVRLWAKLGPDAKPETEDEIKAWMERAKSFPQDREKLIDRTAAVQVETEIMSQALQSNPTFPLTLKLPVNFSGETIVFESRTYKDVEDLRKDRARILFTESERFDHLTSSDLSKAKFTDGREAEQAQLLGRLHIVKAELQKFPNALLDPANRRSRIEEITEILERKDLQPRQNAIYKENRRIFIEEVNFYAGVGRNESVPGADELRLNDLIDLGIEKGKLSLKSQILRLGIVYGVVQALTTLATYEAPTVLDELSQYFNESTIIHQIAEKPENEFDKASRDFLIKRYGLRTQAGHVVWTPQARDAAARIGEARKEFLRSLTDESVEIAAVKQALGLHSAKISPSLFFSIVDSSNDEDVKQRVVAAGITDPIVIKNLLHARSNFQNKITQEPGDAPTTLMEAYADYELEYQ